MQGDSSIVSGGTAHGGTAVADAAVADGTDSFAARHIGPSAEDQRAMLATLGYASLDDLALGPRRRQGAQRRRRPRVGGKRRRQEVVERPVAESGEHGPLVFVGRPDMASGEGGGVINGAIKNGQITLHGASPVWAPHLSPDWLQSACPDPVLGA